MVLDTNVVPDVIGLHDFHDQAALVRVLPGHSQNIVRVLVPDDRAAPPGFHDLLIDDLSDTKVLPASAGDLTVMRQHWPPSLLSGMTKHQIDMEAQRRECKHQFGNLRPGKCSHCGTYINTSLAVPDSMVFCVEGDRPGLRGPSPSPALSRLLCKGQHSGQVFSALDGDTFGLGPCPQAQSVRDRH